MAYAEGTDVPSDKSRLEIERLLVKYKATGFAYATQADRAAISFDMHDRRVRLIVVLPPITQFAISGRGRRTSEATEAAREQELRRRWRCLLLVIKAKLEAVASNIATFEEEFMPYVVMPDGRTVGEHVTPWIAQGYSSGKMPPLLGPHT